MYLNAEHFLSEYDEESSEVIAAIKKAAPLNLGKFKPQNISFQLACWRKANAIHGWFVKNVQEGKDDCEDYYVSLEQLRELKETCEKVLNDNKLAEELLPVTKGFFFGSYEYDEWYTDQLIITVELLDNILSDPNCGKWWIQYRSSW